MVTSCFKNVWVMLQSQPTVHFLAEITDYWSTGFSWTSYVVLPYRKNVLFNRGLSL